MQPTRQHALTAARDGMGVGVLLFLSTLYFSSNALLLLVLGALALRLQLRHLGPQLLLVALFSLLALANIALHIGDFTLERHASSPTVIVVLLASFSLFYLWFLNRVNRHYGAK